MSSREKIRAKSGSLVCIKQDVLMNFATLFTCFLLLFLFAPRWHAISVLLPVEPDYSWKHKFANARPHQPTANGKRSHRRDSLFRTQKAPLHDAPNIKTPAPLRAYCLGLKKGKVLRAISVKTVAARIKYTTGS